MTARNQLALRPSPGAPEPHSDPHSPLKSETSVSLEITSIIMLCIIEWGASLVHSTVRIPRADVPVPLAMIPSSLVL
ncbi:hypothetical protein N7468_006186 [Penicillium chermesinum]|uniref:Uncharacterized protein n=1 Tax=Penicillium chermesinum TaxID=63820 RepID=A0A9W9TJD7_9EURO|nr:uncharacterized protein N7468_006186 [Penicillium chermesinum]KAJ5224961.1 hypothetical protein N7468_006186 [Penicillium chermesinum]